MKVLWLCNVILPDISRCINENVSNYGGWLDGLSKELKTNSQIDLTVVFPYKEYIQGECGNINYYSFINKDAQDTILNRFKEIISNIEPDIIHIWGTEYSHTLHMVNATIQQNMIDKTIISIQGMCSIIAMHYYADLPNRIVRKYTFRDFIKRDNIFLQKQKFIERGKYEIEAIKKVNHVIGRTDWDDACTHQINPNVEYHFCNETLRESFYTGDKWGYNKCEKHSIFISQANYPIKGFHYLVEALPYIIKKHPNTKVYVAGSNIIKNDTFYEKLKINSYGKYIISLINKYKLWNNIIFVGSLNEVEMKKRFLLSNVFVSPSSIENSPNSVGEAMILGVPVVASDVGGVKNLMVHEKEGYLYQSNAPYMLAYYVNKVFSNDKIINTISENASVKALNTHDRKINLDTMLKIYAYIRDKKNI